MEMELIALGKAKPGNLLYASSGQGSIVHLATELFADMAGIKMTHVPYKGTGPAITELVAESRKAAGARRILVIGENE